MPVKREIIDRDDKIRTKYILIIILVIIGIVILFLVLRSFGGVPDLDIGSGKSDEPIVMYSNTQNAVTLEIENFTFVKTKEDYGILTDMTISVTNEGVTDIGPSLYVSASDDKFRVEYRSEKRVTISQTINATTGKISHLKVPIDMGIGGMKNNKNVKVTLYNSLSPYSSNNVVSIDFKANLLNPSYAPTPGALQALKWVFR